MKITVKYFGSDDEQYFASFNLITNYDNVFYLNCSCNGLTWLPNDLPASLKWLDCSDNQLTRLPEWFPPSLQWLNCSDNQLTRLPKQLPLSLQVLKCNGNMLRWLPKTLPPSLLELYCDRNILMQLPVSLPSSLQQLFCSNNLLTALPEVLPSSLCGLGCNDNQLTTLTVELPLSLRSLFCDNNHLTSLPITLLQCIHLNNLSFEGNEIEYIPPVLIRFFDDKQENAGLRVYDDSQSVHNHNIQNSIRRSIYSVLKDRVFLDSEDTMESILLDAALTEQTKSALFEYSNDPEIHSVLNITFSDLLTPVWNRIQIHTDAPEIKKILNKEIADGLCVCFTGRLFRLVNCLNGFYDDVVVQIGSNEQIGNIIVITKEKLERAGEYTVDKHRRYVRKELEERAYSEDIINDWLQFIE